MPAASSTAAAAVVMETSTVDVTRRMTPAVIVTVTSYSVSIYIMCHMSCHASRYDVMTNDAGNVHGITVIRHTSSQASCVMSCRQYRTMTTNGIMTQVTCCA